jgi:hypothetical protein
MTDGPLPRGGLEGWDPALKSKFSRPGFLFRAANIVTSRHVTDEEYHATLTNHTRQSRRGIARKRA